VASILFFETVSEDDKGQKELALEKGKERDMLVTAGPTGLPPVNSSS
jgi:hypothetical protein